MKSKIKIFIILIILLVTTFLLKGSRVFAKSQVSMNESGKIYLTLSDIDDKYDNVYCSERGVGLSGVSQYRVSATIEIIGDEVTLTEYAIDSNGNYKPTTKKETVTLNFANELAAILVAEDKDFGNVSGLGQISGHNLEDSSIKQTGVWHYWDLVMKNMPKEWQDICGGYHEFNGQVSTDRPEMTNKAKEVAEKLASKYNCSVKLYVLKETWEEKNGKDAQNLFLVEKPNTPLYAKIRIIKEWKDGSGNIISAPENISSVKVRIQGNNGFDGIATLNKDNKWEKTIIREIKTGTTNISYKVTEVDVPPNCTSTIKIVKESNPNQTVSTDSYPINESVIITITNTITTQNITVTKKWVDDSNRDNKRPTSVKIILKADGKEVASKDVTGNKTAEKWTHTFTNLPIYNESGKIITYTVDEDVPKDYSKSVDNSTYTITNTHNPIGINIPIKKTWNDSNDWDGNRPESIKVKLKASVKTADGKKTTNILAYNTSGKVIGTSKKENDGTPYNEIEIKSPWTYTINNLYKYANQGQLIEYKLEEIDIPEYEENVEPNSLNGDSKNLASGFSITNTNEPETINIPITKKWVDDSNRDGKRPDSITLHLTATADNKKIEAKDVNNNTIGTAKYDKNNNFLYNEIIINAPTNSSNEWTYNINDLYKYAPGKKLITYKLEEVDISGYTKNIQPTTLTGNSNKLANGFEITNTHQTEKITISVTKKWEDDGDRDGLRPESIIVNLYANDTDTKKSVTLNKANNWNDKFEGLNEYENGNRIKYTLKEIRINDYEVKIEPQEIVGTNKTTLEQFDVIITNTHIPEKIDIPVTKTWDDENDLDEYRPDSITVKLFENTKKDGKDVKTLKAEVQLNESNNWSYTFTDLYKYYYKRQLITYTIEEAAIDSRLNYEAPVITPTSIQGSTTKGDRTTTGFTITNKHVPQYDGYIEISGKVWLDGESGKANDINGTYGSEDKGLEGIKVNLKDSNNKLFNETSIATTDKDGNYTIKVNYDNRQNVYKLYEDSATVKEKLKTAYVEFEYDGMLYTTVATSATGGNTSKAIEDADLRNTFDGNHSTIKSDTKHPDEWDDKTMIASTKNLISFENYNDKTNTKKEVVLKYCKGDGTYIRTNPEGAWKDILPGTNNLACKNGKGHNITTWEVDVEIIQNVNLGLFRREQPDVAINSDLSEVEVIMQGQKYTYLYNVVTDENNDDNDDELQAQFQSGVGYHTYRRPINAADIAYINEEGNEDLLEVYVTYKVIVQNKSYTMPITVNSIINTYDVDYTIESIVRGKDNPETVLFTPLNNDNPIGENDLYYKQGTLNDLNITVRHDEDEAKPEDEIYIKYKVSLEEIKNLLNDESSLHNAVEINEYTTKYGESTLYAEQKSGERTNQSYGGYDYNSHPGNAGLKVEKTTYTYTENGTTKEFKDVEILKADNPEDDTSIAPSFILHKDDYKVLSGNVWEDLDVNYKDSVLLGDGKNTEGKNVSKVKVELLKEYTNADGTISYELANLYKIKAGESEGNNEPTPIPAVTYTNDDGYYSFGNNGDNVDNRFGVVTDNYKLRFTYGDETIFEVNETVEDNYLGFDGIVNGGTWGDDYLSLDGTDDWVNLGQVSFTNVAAGTIEATVAIDSLKSEAQYIMTNGEYQGVTLAVDKNGCIYMALGVENSGTVKYKYAESNKVMNIGQKYHVVAMVDGNKMKLYADGELIAQNTFTGEWRYPANNTVMALGTNPTGSSIGGKMANIKVYDAKVYDAVLTQAQINQNKEGNTVKDGLIKHYNATNNTGSGHSNSTTNWRDLASYWDTPVIEEGPTNVSGTEINARNYKSTIISEDNKALHDLYVAEINKTEVDHDYEWYLKINKGYSVAVDDIKERVKTQDLKYSNFNDKLNMTAESKPFRVTIEFNPNSDKKSSVGANGYSGFDEEINVFDFGIIERPKEDLFVEKTIDNIRIVLANGQHLIDGNPSTQSIDYVKGVGFQKSITNGSEARNAIDKQLVAEIDSELIQGAQLEIRYEIKVTNNSDVDYDYYVDENPISAENSYDESKVRKLYYYLGKTDNKNAKGEIIYKEEAPKTIKSSVNRLIDYVDSDIEMELENPQNWTKVEKATSIKGSLINNKAAELISNGEYIAFTTTQFKDLAPGESKSDYVYAKRLLANGDENVYDNHIEIIEIDAKVARTIYGRDLGAGGNIIKAKMYKPGNYIPSLEAKKLYNQHGISPVEEEGMHEQDDGRVKMIITPPTGITTYIISYSLVTLAVLIIMFSVVLIIKKKVLKR